MAKMCAAKTIIISAPKFIANDTTFGLTVKSGNSLLSRNTKKLPRFNQTVPMQCISTIENIACSPLNMLGIEGHLGSSQPSRKRRLDHLTFEEKIQRKKLKNRIAAQSSRDRKKAKMDELEAEVKELKEKNKCLFMRCKTLECEKEQLVTENSELRKKLSQTENVVCGSSSAGPAASCAFNPLQKGRDPQGARSLPLVMMLLCLCYQTSWETLITTISSHKLKTLQTASLKRLLQQLVAVKLRSSCLKKIETGAVQLKWWGHHQKMWNPVERLY